MNKIYSKSVSNLKYHLRDRNKYYSILIAAYLILSMIGMAHHEMWRDELESWLIARDSSSISELYSNLTYVGHPFLWYLCLYVLAKLTRNPVAIQGLHLIIATSVISIFLFYSPFNRLQKFLFCFSYFPLYEYGIISRNYSLGFLFIFLFCALYSKPKHNYILLATSLVLASQTNVYSLIIAFALALMMFGEKILKTFIKGRKLLFERQFYGGLAIYIFGLMAALAQIIRAKSALDTAKLGATADATFLPVAHLSTVQDNYAIAILKNCWAFILDYEKVLTGIWRSYVPIPDSPSKYLWGSNFLVATQKFSLGSINLALLAALALSLLLFLFFAAVFVRQKNVLFTYVCGTVAIYLFGYVAKIPLLRHNGHLFILLIVCYWLFCDRQKQKSDRPALKSKLIRSIQKKQTVALTAILFIQVYAGANLYIRDLFQPFSNVNNVVQFIRDNQLEDSVIVGTADMNVFPLSAWLNKKVYYPEIADFGTYTVWTPTSVSRNSDLTEFEIIQQARKLERENNQDLLIVTDKELQIDIQNFNIRLLAMFKGKSLIYEEYFIYSME